MSEDLDKTGIETSASTLDETPSEPPPPEPEGSDAEDSQPQEPQFEWGDGLDVHITNDKLTAKLEVNVEYAKHYSASDLKRFAKSSNIQIDCIDGIFESILNNKRYNEQIVIARGQPPKNGRDGYVDWKIDLSILDGAKLKEHAGRVDWKESTRVLQVTTDQLLATLVPPKNGVDGYNVHNETLESKPGKEMRLPAGKNVRVNETGEEMYAEIDGVICREGEKISVSQVLDVESDVSYNTGNIVYEGTVVIKGGVLPDFKIDAGQDLHIEGLIEGATIEAAGNIFMNGGIQGEGKAHIQAGGEISVKYINNATVEAKGDIHVQGSIVQSAVRSFKSVRVDGNKAVITGGHVFAEEEIETGILGAEIGTKTILTLGNEMVKFAEKIQEHEKKYITIEANKKKMEQASAQLNVLSEKGKLTPKHEEMRLKITRALMQIKGQSQMLAKTIKTMKQELELGRQKQRGVIAKEMAHPGVVVEIMGKKHLVKMPKPKVLFAMPGDEVVEYGYKPHEEKKPKKDEPQSEEQDQKKE